MIRISGGISTITCDNCGAIETTKNLPPYTLPNWVKIFIRDRRGVYKQIELCKDCDVSTIKVGQWV